MLTSYLFLKDGSELNMPHLWVISSAHYLSIQNYLGSRFCIKEDPKGGR